MKTFFAIACALLCLPSSGWGTPKPKVRRALPVVPDGYTISEADVRKTIEHMQQLARDQQTRVDAQDAVIQRQESIIASQATDLDKATAATKRIQDTSADLLNQIGALNNQLADEKWARFKAMIFGWPISLGFGVVLGIGLAVFSRLGAKVAALGARVGLKAATGI